MHKIKTLSTAVAFMVLAAGAQAQQAARKPYLIELADAPVASYGGGVAGLKATRPAPGQRLVVNASDVQAYMAYLDAKQASVTSYVASAPVTYRYKTVVNGFAAWLTDAELIKVMSHSGVRSVTADERLPLNTSRTPAFLGVSEPGGAWSITGPDGKPVKGENVILGHVDGGIWPENPSVSDKVDANGKPIASHLPGTLVYAPLPAGRYTGSCQPGLGFNASMCNNKLVGAQYFNSTWKLAVSLGLVTTWAGEYLDSPRDADGHGTHTLTTAGGNENVDVEVNGVAIPGISGIAPRARLAAYKSCYVPLTNGAPGQGSCYASDSVAAIEKAVADGVDVINFSIGGSQTSVRDAVQTAFANAALSGVFVAASAGNSGPGNTVAHSSPWVTTVGNSTHDRSTVATVTLGNGYQATGPSFQTAGIPSKPLIWSRQAGFDNVPVTDNQALCFGPADGASPLLDPAKVAGKILICERGGNVLVNKATNAKTAGAAGMVLLNTPTSANSVLTIAFAVPTVHVSNVHHAAITAYVAGASPTAAFSGAVLLPGVIAPVMNDSSSRGPSLADLNILKPDITAPGTDIIAAYTNQSITPAQRQQIIDGTLVPGPGANMITGTSMSSPHVAGAAALLRQANPTWSPFAIKSALMTSAQQSVKLANGATDTNRWGFGSGHLNPNGALATKVVYDQSIFDHINYYNGALGGRDLNLASLTHANVVGVGSLTRTLSNKGSTAVTYTGAATLPGFNVSVSPSTLTIPAGGSASYTVTMSRATQAIETWSFGEVVWTSNAGPTLRSPLTAKPSELVASALVTDTRNVGTKVFTVGTGYDGRLYLTPTGLLPADRRTGRVALNATTCFPFTVPAGTKRLRVQLFDADTEGGAASDLDLRVLRGSTQVGASGGATSDELVALTNPTAATTYQACVDGYAPINGDAGFGLSIWTLGSTNPGTLKAFGPTAVKTAGVTSIGMSWNVASGARYLGLIEYRSAVGGPVIGATQVFVDNAAPLSTVAKVPVYRVKPEL